VRVIQDEKAAEQNESINLYSKFAVRFSYSPDFSSVGLSNFSKPGSALSALVEYNLTNKLSTQIGVTKSLKKYNAKEGQYEWPKEWKTGPRPINTDATCNMIEFPISLRYNIAQSDIFKLFATIGASSYYMQKEKYVYNYEPHTYGIKWYDYETKTGWFWLSHGDMSIGYEQKISEKISLIAEPYVKVPLKKIGYGKVNLLTTGAWLSIKYSFSRE
jgi:hypothetical protein